VKLVIDKDYNIKLSLRETCCFKRMW